VNPENTAEAAAPALRILVVDDHRDHADTLVRLLRLFGYDAKPLCDPLSVPQEAAAFRPHAFLIDMVMPHMNGLALAKKLRESPETSDALLIGMTAFHGEFQHNQAAAAVFDHLLLKPVDRFALERVLESRAKDVLNMG
jgi:CheY-like chemotaxis protein